MKKYWHLFWHFRKIQLMKMMEYRSDFWFWLIVSTMWTIFNYFMYGLIIGNSNGIAGWSYDEVMILLSFFTMLDAFTWSLFFPNMLNYTESIYDGSLSKLFVQPVNSVFLILTQYMTYHNIPRFFIGLIVLIHTVKKIGLTISLGQILLASLLFIVAIIFIYTVWFIIATLAFWVERLNNINQIVPAFRSIYQMPVQIYKGFTAILFSFIIPLGLLTTLPSEAILNRNNLFAIIYFIIFTTILVILSLWFYKKSTNKYSSVGG